MSLVYLDSSALVKLVVREPESDALVTFLHDYPDRVSSALALAEVPRALRRAALGPAARRRGQAVLARVALVDVDRRVLTIAAMIDPPTIRTLDAIHLATALTLHEDLASFVTYDRRLGVAAERADLPVRVPV